ncbi:MAG: GTPase Era [Candidatus Sumerlaeaceae bacterium]|nr:GTPase Era [Candidatus Sumerlaeaceae bacterium]
MDKPFRSGYAAILGKPNAGKSTLMNALVGMKIAIVSDKPQTTRDRIGGILTGDDYQIVFVDTPGVIVPRDRLNESLMARAEEAIEHVDVLLHLVDATDREPPNERLTALLARARPRARLLVVNKTDLLAPEHRDRLPPGLDSADYAATVRVSALQRAGLDRLIAEIVSHLPAGPLYYDPDQLSDRDERFFAAEAVREKVFLYLQQEVPYAVYTEVDAFEERPQKDFIRIIIYVEHESQKGIVIGEGGRTLKQIGREARQEIEALTGRPAYLELWVKVRKNWRRREPDLVRFGFKKPGR